MSFIVTTSVNDAPAASWVPGGTDSEINCALSDGTIRPSRTSGLSLHFLDRRMVRERLLPKNGRRIAFTTCLLAPKTQRKKSRRGVRFRMPPCEKRQWFQFYYTNLLTSASYDHQRLDFSRAPLI